MPALLGSPEMTVNFAFCSKTGGGAPHFRSGGFTMTCSDLAIWATATPMIDTRATAQQARTFFIATLLVRVDEPVAHYLPGRVVFRWGGDRCGRRGGEEG